MHKKNYPEDKNRTFIYIYFIGKFSIVFKAKNILS